jgi:hypothetical protein
MSYVEELEKQNDELQQRLAKQQEENIALAKENKFAPHWVPIVKVNYPSDPETYHYKIGETIIAIVFLERNKQMTWNRVVYGATLINYCCAFSCAKTAMIHVEHELWADKDVFKPLAGK